MDANAIFAVMADLAPTGRTDTSLEVLRPGAVAMYCSLTAQQVSNNKTTRWLAGLDSLRRDERLLRFGWGLIVGNSTVDGRRVRVRLPLYTRPVRLRKKDGNYRIISAGDIEPNELLNGQETYGAGYDDLPISLAANGSVDKQQLLAQARATGLDVTEVVEKIPSRSHRGLAVVATGVIFVSETRTVTGVAEQLRRWSETDDLKGTALHAMYGLGDDRPAVARENEADAPLACALPLDLDQEKTVRRSRHEAVTVVSGAPGCGKSHTLAAIAQDAIARGESVLMVTQSVYASDVLADLLSRSQGPTPVMFGDSERRKTLLTELASGAESYPDAELAEVLNQVANDERSVRAIESRIKKALIQEHLAREHEPTDVVVLNDFPGLAKIDTDLDLVSRLWQQLATNPSGWLGWLKRRWWTYRLTKRVGTTRLSDGLEHAVEVARRLHAASKLASLGGVDLSDEWDALASADQRLAASRGEALLRKVRSSDRRDAAAVRAMSALRGALKASRWARRDKLAAIDVEPLLKAMPLWIGTAVDVEAVLPAAAGMFDLVIIDEASHVDQIRAAPVLVRAKRAVVSGDPNQLRFVSFVSDASIETVLAVHGVTENMDRLDVRRYSAYDVAASASTVTRLGEHYRSVPHLIGFSSARFYGGRVRAVTTHPSNHTVDAIDSHIVEEPVVVSGINKSELSRMLDLTRQLLSSGHRDVALLTPFRAQTDALEALMLDSYSAEEIGQYGLRTGTVHAFQGSEADTVIVGLTVVDSDSPGRRRFVADQHLFNVMMTRAKRKLHVVTSLSNPTGIIGDFMTYASRPLPVPKAGQSDEWAEKLAVELAQLKVVTHVGYPVGRWSVDVCAGTGSTALAIIGGPHPGGPTQHLARQRVLRRAGWKTVDVFPSKFSGNPVNAALWIYNMLDDSTKLSEPPT